MKNNKMKKTILALSLAAVLGLGGTLAYMSSTTNDKQNIFTVGAAISGELREPTWDGDNFTNEDNQVVVDTDNLGKDKAVEFVPNRVINKDPAVANTSEGTEAYIGVTIAYTGATSKADLETFATVNWNTTDWDFNEDYTYAVYKNPVAAGAKTTPLFTTVTINEDATSATMKNFDITLKGYLVQSEGFDTAAAALAGGFADIFK